LEENYLKAKSKIMSGEGQTMFLLAHPVLLHLFQEEELKADYV